MPSMTNSRPTEVSAGPNRFLVVVLMAILALTACSEEGSSPTTGGATDAANTSAASDGQDLIPVELTVGWLIFGPGESVVPIWMEQEGLFEEAAREMGYDLTVDYQAFPTGAPMIQGLAAEEIDVGVMGAVPMLNLIAQDTGIAPLTLSSGNLRFLLTVKPDSEYRSIEDLEGASIALVVGTDLQGFVDNLTQARYGVRADEYFNIVNVQTPAQGANIPDGADAGVTVSPPFLEAQEEVGTNALVNSYGETEDYYIGPEGEGAGHLLDGAEESPFWPEGFLAHRGYWVMRDEVLEENPELATAWTVAHARALEALVDMPADEVAALNTEWGLTPEQGAQVVEDDLIRQREFVFLTEGDAGVVHTVAADRFAAGSLEVEFTWDDITGLFAKAEDPLRTAYEILGETPAESVFLDTSSDLRGLPSWEWEQWSPTR